MQQVKVPDSVYDKAKQIRDEKEFSSLGDALRFMLMEGGYDV